MYATSITTAEHTGGALQCLSNTLDPAQAPQAVSQPQTASVAVSCHFAWSSLSAFVKDPCDTAGGRPGNRSRETPLLPSVMADPSWCDVHKLEFSACMEQVPAAARLLPCLPLLRWWRTGLAGPVASARSPFPLFQGCCCCCCCCCQLLSVESLYSESETQLLLAVDVGGGAATEVVVTTVTVVVVVSYFSY